MSSRSGFLRGFVNKSWLFLCLGSGTNCGSSTFCGCDLRGHNLVVSPFCVSFGFVTVLCCDPIRLGDFPAQCRRIIINCWKHVASHGMGL